LLGQKLPSDVSCEGSRPPITSIWPCPMTWQKWFARRDSVRAPALNHVNEGIDKTYTSRYPGSLGLAISAVEFVEPPNTYLQIGSQLALQEINALDEDLHFIRAVIRWCRTDGTELRPRRRYRTGRCLVIPSLAFNVVDRDVRHIH
jgi:hypothetical protein